MEYIISERLFRELPEEEKRYWHSHRWAGGGRRGMQARDSACKLQLRPRLGIDLQLSISVAPALCTPAASGCGARDPWLANQPCIVLPPARRYEVGSGLLVAPGVPDVAERQDMQKLIGGRELLNKKKQGLEERTGRAGADSAERARLKPVLAGRGRMRTHFALRADSLVH